jgi:hypothetical protein
VFKFLGFSEFFSGEALGLWRRFPFSDRRHGISLSVDFTLAV